MPYLPVSHAKLYYEVYPAIDESRGYVTLVNGYSRSLSDFRMLSRKLTEAGYSVLAFDQRGAGQSETDAPFTLADLAGDIHALWQHLKIQSSHLLGISMGGIVAQVAASIDVSRIKSLCLVSTLAEGRYYLKKDAVWPEDLNALEAELATYFAPAFVQKNNLLVKAMAKTTLRSLQEGLTEKSRLQREALKDLDSYLPRSIDAKIPILIIHGREDHIIPAAAAEALKTLLPHAKLVIFENCGHLILAEKHSDFFAELAGFWI